MLRDVRSHQRGVRLIEAQVDVSEIAGKTETTDGILRGSERLLATDLLTNDCRLKIAEPGSRDCMLLGLVSHGLPGAAVSFIGAGVDYVDLYHAGDDFTALIAVFDSTDET